MQTPAAEAARQAIGAHPCPVCGAEAPQIFMELAQLPVHCNLLWEDQAAAQAAPRGDIRLAFCPTCSHVHNQAFDPALMEYTQSYENSLHFSARFQSYADTLAARLIERYDLRGKDIVEIGCGKGDFLKQLCRLGGNHGVGFDPSYVPDPHDDGDAAVQFVLDFYGEQYTHYRADLIVCRHVLEHIQHPREFLANVRRSIGEGRQPAVFFELPNVLYTLRDMGIWDIIYEHCSYYSPGSLAHIFEASGFEVQALNEEFGGQFLSIESRPARAGSAPTRRNWTGFDRMERDVAAFADNYRAKVEEWQCTLAQIGRAGRRAVVWGSGSKGVTFLNVFRENSPIEYVVDINTRKQGMFVAGSGQPIVAPAFLRDYRPDVVVIMNPIYHGEIQQTLAALSITAEVVVA
jgi:SAM-dependent methyltransferase